jgi:hypothetical protein
VRWHAHQSSAELISSLIGGGQKGRGEHAELISSLIGALAAVWRPSDGSDVAATVVLSGGEKSRDWCDVLRWWSRPFIGARGGGARSC